MLVVDASVALKWVLDEPGDREARALVETGEPLVAPELIVAEVVNVAWKRLLAGEIAARQAAVIAEEVPRIFAELLAIGPLRMRALEIANELRHPAYDCFYLALAELRAAPLVTADRRLIARVAGTPWEPQMVSLWT
ncbi:MAG: type II toxin-antitoxin system VapC family toxin [Geminicoccales bacterium]